MSSSPAVSAAAGGALRIAQRAVENQGEVISGETVPVASDQWSVRKMGRMEGWKDGREKEWMVGKREDEAVGSGEERKMGRVEGRKKRKREDGESGCRWLVRKEGRMEERKMGRMEGGKIV